MAEIVKTLLTQILLRNDTEANWIEANPKLGKGEIAISTDKNQFKIGDGESNWSALSYFEGNLATRVTNLETHESDYEAKVNALETELYGTGGSNENSRLDQLAGKVNDLEVTGGQANVIEGVAVKTVADGAYVPLTITEKVAQLDLSGYAKPADITNALASYYTKLEADAEFIDADELAAELEKYVALSVYEAKVEELEGADIELGKRIDAIYKVTGEGENKQETGVLIEKIDAVNNTINGLSFYTKNEIDGKVDAINTAINGKVAQSDYNTKVEALVAEDARIAGLVAAEELRAKGVEEALQNSINDVNTELTTNYETKTVAEGKYLQIKDAESTYLSQTNAQLTYETIANVDVIRNTLNGTGEGEAHVKGLVEKVADNTAAITTNANEIKALQRAQAGGLDRVIINAAQLQAYIANPASAADNAIYMVLSQGAGIGEANDIYDEYIKVRTSAEGVEPATYVMEFLGDTEVDLSQYYTRTEIDNKGYATTEYVNIELGKKVDTSSYTTDQNELKGKVDKVVAKLSDIEEGKTVKAVIDAAVEVEKTRATGVESGLDTRIKAIEDLKISENYAKQKDLEDEATTRENDDNALSDRIQAIENLGLIEGSKYATVAQLEVEQDRIDDLEGKVDLADGETVTGKIAELYKETVSEVEGQSVTTYSGKVVDYVNNKVAVVNNDLDAVEAQVAALIGSDTPAEGEDQKSIREIAAEVHEANEFVKSVDAGLSVDSEGKLSFAEGVFVLDGGNAKLHSA